MYGDEFNDSKFFDEIQRLNKIILTDEIKNIEKEKIKLKNLEDIRSFISQNFEDKFITELNYQLHFNENFKEELKKLLSDNKSLK